MMETQGAIIIPTQNPHLGKGKGVRKKKNCKQTETLATAFQSRQQWSKDDINKLSEMTGLTKSQVYKWNWDMRKRSVADLNEMSNEPQLTDEDQSKIIKGPSKSKKVEPSVTSAFRLYMPTDMDSAGKLNKMSNFPSIGDAPSMEAI